MPARTRRSPVWLLIDVAVVLVFATVGRASHERGFGTFGVGVLETAWPFLAALVVGWVVTLAWLRPDATVRVGLPLWAITVVGGLALRAVTGEGIAVPFIIVATLTLLLGIVGWRVVGTIIAAVRRPRQ